MAFEGQKTAGELPKIIPLETLHAEMEMTKWILELTEVVNDLSIFLPKSSLLPLGMEFITQIKPFTLLMFEKTPPNQAVDSSMVSEKKRYNYCYLI